jgi:hypothetical protein
MAIVQDSGRFLPCALRFPTLMKFILSALEKRQGVFYEYLNFGSSVQLPRQNLPHAAIGKQSVKQIICNENRGLRHLTHANNGINVSAPCTTARCGPPMTEHDK